MAPSNKKGKILLKGIFKGLKFYFLDDRAKFHLKKGINLIIKIAKKANSPLIYHTGMTLELTKNNSPKHIDDFIESSIKKTLSSVHVMSSAAIGENRKFCPLNSKGKIPGINNLLIVDQSSLPTCPTVNPQATSCVISLINTKKFLNEKNKSTLIITGAGGWLGSSLLELSNEKCFKDNFKRIILCTLKKEDVISKNKFIKINQNNPIKFNWIYGNLYTMNFTEILHNLLIRRKSKSYLCCLNNSCEIIE